MKGSMLTLFKTQQQLCRKLFIYSFGLSIIYLTTISAQFTLIMYSLPDLFLMYNNWMSYEALLAQNKILAYFTLDTSANVQANSLLQPSEYAIFIFHNHYPAIYYQAIFDHFRHCLPE